MEQRMQLIRCSTLEEAKEQMEVLENNPSISNVAMIENSVDGGYDVYYGVSDPRY